MEVVRATEVTDGPPGAAAGAAPGGLTLREREVLRLIAAGRVDREIAGLLRVSPRTVATHVARVLVKLGTPTRASAAAVAVRRGLI